MPTFQRGRPNRAVIRGGNTRGGEVETPGRGATIARKNAGGNPCVHLRRAPRPPVGDGRQVCATPCRGVLIPQANEARAAIGATEVGM
jgi:hypothetical protein